VKKIYRVFENMKLTTKLAMSYAVIIVAVICFIGIRYYFLSFDVIKDIARKNVYEVVKKNTEIIDARLSQTKENIQALIMDGDLYNAFSTIKHDNKYNIYLLDSRVTRILDKYFLQSKDVFSAQLATNYYIFGNNPNKSFIPENKFSQSELYSKAIEADGALIWYPTYDFAQIYNMESLRNVNVDYKYMFSAAQVINSSFFDETDYSKLNNDIERPIIILNFKEEFFRNIFSNSIPTDEGYFFIFSKDGYVISSQDQSMLATKLEAPWVEQIAQKVSGTDIIENNGKKMIICFDTSKTTGWISAVLIPSGRLAEQIIPPIKKFIIYATIIVALISIMLSYLFSVKITKPINRIIKAIKKIGEGDFSIKIAEEGSVEFKELIERFNRMNEKIHRLIKENYEIKIKEKEAEITALNLQLDPHFMYNTLNLINLISIDNEQEEISEMIMCLSSMLKYTVKNKKDLVMFKDDLEYLKSYIFIMTKRFEGKFSAIYDIAPELYESKVPKFFMQPIVENSLIHGFALMRSGGILEIKCWTDEESRYFRVKDNGKGMDANKLRQLTDKAEAVGVSNVDRRIKILFGENYGVKIESELLKGTSVTIKLPLLGISQS